MKDRLDLDHIEQTARLIKAEQILWLIEEGKTEIEICGKLDISIDECRELKSRGLRAHVDAIRSRSTEEVYAEYLLNQAANLRELTQIAKDAGTNKRDLQTRVSAVRARSNIYDQIIKTGQEFGIIERRAARTEVVMGLLIADLSDDELRSRIAGELKGLNDLMERFGDKDLIDVQPGRLHRKLPSLPSGTKPRSPFPAKDASKKNRARANKVHGGRRIVKE